jgi:hypothetical protein
MYQLSYIKRQTEEFYEKYIFPNSYFPFSVACVDLYCKCHNKLIIRYKSVHKFDKFNNGGLNRIGLTKDTTDAHNYDANSFLSKR